MTTVTNQVHIADESQQSPVPFAHDITEDNITLVRTLAASLLRIPDIWQRCSDRIGSQERLILEDSLGLPIPGEHDPESLSIIGEIADRVTDTATWECQLFQNTQTLCRTLGLTTLDARILSYLALLDEGGILETLTDCLPRASLSGGFRYFARILKCRREDIENAIGPNSALNTLGLLEISKISGLGFEIGRDLDLDKSLAQKLLSSVSMSESAFLDAFFESKGACPSLTIQDFSYLESELDYIIKLISVTSRGLGKPVSILLHGGPGVGKTEIAHLVAQQTGAYLAEITGDGEDGGSITADARLKRFRVTMRALKESPRPYLVLVDECEPVLEVSGSMGQFFSNVNDPTKSSLTKALESTTHPSIWISNSIDEADAALLRRFSMIVEVKRPPRSKRISMIKNLCCNIELSDEFISDLVDHPAVSPAMIHSTAETTNQILKEGDGQYLAHQAVFQTIIQGYLRAMETDQEELGIGRQSQLPHRTDLIEADADTEKLLRLAESQMSARFLLSGAPGTGKSLWARELSRRAGAPLHCKDAAELLSMYVGQTEKNVKRAFSEAAADNAILVIDEVDSLLMSRSSANRHYEVTLVNQLLSCLDSFNGIVVATTNNLDSIDSAALRRFDFKIRFQALSTQNLSSLLETICPENPSLIKSELDSLGSCRLDRAVTFGDVENALWKLKLMDRTPNVDAVLAEITKEIERKEPVTIGFIRD